MFSFNHWLERRCIEFSRVSFLHNVKLFHSLLCWVFTHKEFICTKVYSAFTSDSCVSYFLPVVRNVNRNKLQFHTHILGKKEEAIFFCCRESQINKSTSEAWNCTLYFSLILFLPCNVYQFNGIRQIYFYILLSLTKWSILPHSLTSQWMHQLIPTLWFSLSPFQWVS